MSRKQRSRAPKEVKKCCRRDGVWERHGRREGELEPHPALFLVSIRMHIHSLLPSFVPECLSCANLALDTAVTVMRTWPWAYPLALSPELTVQGKRQAHLQTGSVQSDWAVRGGGPRYFPSLLCPLEWSTVLLQTNKTQREFCCEVSCGCVCLCFCVCVSPSPFLSGPLV